MKALSTQASEGGDSPSKVIEDLEGLMLKDYAIVMLDSLGHITQWNVGVYHLYGFSSDEVIEEHFSKFYTSEDQEIGLPAEHLEVAEKNGRLEYEGQKQKKDGTQFYANAIITALYNNDGTLRGYAKVTRDITVQKKLEEENRILTDLLEEKVEQRTKELAVVNRELEAFSYSVSHDLRTPLRAISGYSFMLKEDYEAQLDAEGKRIINTIVHNTKMMGSLIDDLLTFSKLSRLEFVNDFVNMKDLAERCLNELLPLQSRNDYDVSVCDIPTCKGDGNMLKQVWHNLVANALKYSSKKSKPQIEIGAIDDDKNSTYYVKDNGSGFDMKYSNKLFGVFQRLHRQDEFEGTGLGLALAKRIVTKHGGEIRGEATLSEGATFYFTIPKHL